MDTPDVPAVVEFVMKMLGARWFSRAWCAHEIRMNKRDKVNNSLLLCFGVDKHVLSFEFRFIYYLAACLKTPEVQAARKDIPFDLNRPISEMPAVCADTSCPTLFQRMVRMHRLAAQGPDSQISLLDHLVFQPLFARKSLTSAPLQ